MADFENPGSFYLGRPHDLSSAKTAAEPLLYDSKDLTTHAVCVGMTGSGKTGLCLALLEEAALNGIPAIAIDPKGDLGNLLLAFPNLAPSDFRPWIDESEAARKQKTPDEFAADQAELWRNGLAKWDEGPDRIQRFCDSVDRVIYTPGSSAGIPITVLKSFAAPPKELIADADAFNERVASATSGLLALMGVDADPVRSREHIFLSTLLDTAWRAGRDVDLRQLIQDINRPPIKSVGAVDLESFYPAKDRTKLAMSLNNLIASPSFASWLEGEPLDIAKILYTPEKKPRLAIFSIAHLDDAQRMFFVTILLNEILAWVRTQPGTSSLRALLYMDEVFGYFPPLGNPPAKRPMLTLLKQARAYGLGCVLATQNPVDLDYKGLSNAGTWFLGRLQTERDKGRVMEGLEGASAQAGATFNRQQMEAALAALGNRVFLMNNVHDDKPVVFQSRWAMSYLCGPLTKSQIKTLMDPVRSKYPGAVASGKSDSGVSSASDPAAGGSRPVVAAGIREKFYTITERVPDGYKLEYRPALLGKGKVHFVHKADGIDVWQTWYLLQPIKSTPPDDIWHDASVSSATPDTEDAPESQACFADLPEEFSREKSYSIFLKQLKEHLYREQTLELWRCEALEETSKANESQDDFRARIAPQCASKLAEKRADVEKKYYAKISEAKSRLEKAQSNTGLWQWVLRRGYALWVLVDNACAAFGKNLPGRRGSVGSAFQKIATEDKRSSDAKVVVQREKQNLEQLEDDRDAEIKEWENQLNSAALTIAPFKVKPEKSDIAADDIALVWLPFRLSADGKVVAIYNQPGDKE